MQLAFNAREYSLLPYLETLVKDIHFQQNGCRDHHVVVLRPEFCISRLKIHRSETKSGKRKFKRMLIFLFVEEGKLFIKKSSFEEFHLVFLTAEHMVCFESDNDEGHPQHTTYSTREGRSATQLMLF